MADLNVAILLITVAFYKQLLAVCFDEEFAYLRGVKVQCFYLLLLIMTALTVVSLVPVVGVA
jgi:zinc transport system permease protein